MAKDSTYPQIKNADPTVDRAVRIAYEYIYTLAGRKGPVTIEDNLDLPNNVVLAINSKNPAPRELITRRYADANYGPAAVALQLSSTGSTPLNITTLPGYATSRFEYGATNGRPARGAADGQIYNDTTSGIVYRWNEATQSWEVVTGTGVHILLDANIDSDTTNSPVEAGDVIYGNATPKWTRLAKGTNGQVLTLAAGLPSWATPTSPTDSGWTDDGTVVRLTTVTDAVGIGTTTPGTNAKVHITGNALAIGTVVVTADATIHINGSYGGNDRLTQMSPVGNSKPGLNLMSSTDGGGSNQYWSWGVDTDATWKIRSGTSFAADVLTMSSSVIALGGGASAIELRFMEPSGSGTNYTSFKAQAQAGNVVYTLPAADATVSGYVLSSNAAGTLSWISAAGANLWSRSGTITYGSNTGDQYVIGGASPSTGTVKLDVQGQVMADNGTAAEPGFTFGGARSGMWRSANTLRFSEQGGEVFSIDTFGLMKYFYALVALGGGAAPTFGTIGTNGPATAAQNSWLKFYDSTGAACFFPVWK